GAAFALEVAEVLRYAGRERPGATALFLLQPRRLECQLAPPALDALPEALHAEVTILTGARLLHDRVHDRSDAGGETAGRGGHRVHEPGERRLLEGLQPRRDRKSTRLNSSH